MSYPKLLLIRPSVPAAPPSRRGRSGPSAPLLRPRRGGASPPDALPRDRPPDCLARGARRRPRILLARQTALLGPSFPRSPAPPPAPSPGARAPPPRPRPGIRPAGLRRSREGRFAPGRARGDRAPSAAARLDPRHAERTSHPWNARWGRTASRASPRARRSPISTSSAAGPAISSAPSPPRTTPPGKPPSPPRRRPPSNRTGCRLG